MTRITTVCARDCYDTCALIATLDDSGRLISVANDPDHAITGGMTCPRATRDPQRLRTNRIKSPAFREIDKFSPVKWNSALDRVAVKLDSVLKRHGPASVLYLNYAGNMGLLTEAFPKRLWNAIGATRTDGAICSRSGIAALKLHYGDSYGLMPEDLLHQKLIIFWGFNPAVSAPHIWNLARTARKRRGTQIVVVDPVKTRTARGADLWIRPRPGTDSALAYGIMDDLIRNRDVDAEFIKKWTFGFHHLKKEAALWHMDRAAKVTGVAPRFIHALGRAYAERKPSATLIGIGLQKCEQGAEQVRAVSLIPGLLGYHRGFFYSSGRAFYVDEGMISGQSLTSKPHMTVSQTGLSKRVGAGRFKFIFISGMNPTATLPDASTFRAGLSRKDVFVAVCDSHWTSTARLADVVLPAPTYLEKDDLVIPWGHGHIQISRKIVSPVTDSRNEVHIMQEIAGRIGSTESWLFENPWSCVEKALENALHDGDYASLKAGNRLKLKRKPLDVYPTSSGKIEFYATAAEENGDNPLPQVKIPACAADQFQLLASATPKYTSTQFQEVYGKIPAVVTMNPQDADRLGLDKDGSVFIKNEKGRIRMAVILSDAVPEGVLWTPRQSEDDSGTPLNCLTSGNPQTIGGGPRFNSTLVNVVKA